MLQSFKLALKSIWSNKMRSFLTMLGIIIGVASVIILVSLVNGYMSTVVENFASMGVNQMSVRLTNLSSRKADVDDFYEFYSENTDIFAQMSPNVSLMATLKKGNDSLTSTSISGCSEEDKTEIFRISEVFGVPVIDYDGTAVILECTQTEKDNDHLIALLKKNFVNRIEIVRGGSVAIEAVGFAKGMFR